MQKKAPGGGQAAYSETLHELRGLGNDCSRFAILLTLTRRRFGQLSIYHSGLGLAAGHKAG